MKAMNVGPDKELIWDDVPDPVMRDTDVLVEIHAAALNRADLLQREGKYPPPPGWPEWMGLEMAGVIKKIGAKAAGNWKTGDAVCGLLGGGGYAEMIALDPSLLMPVPKGLSMPEAAALPEVFATAYLDLVDQAGMKPGETVLIHAGASGLGMAAIQLAKASGAKVITTVSSPDKARAVSAIGADIVVNRSTDDLGRVMDGNPVDIVMDCIGGEPLGKFIEKLSIGGRWILVATLGGEHATIPLRPVLKRALRLIGVTLRGQPTVKKAGILAALVTQVWPLIESGIIRPSLYRVLPVQRADEAHHILTCRENIGKVVLTVR